MNLLIQLGKINLLLVFLMPALFATQAQACSKIDLICQANEAITKAVDKAVNAAKDEATKIINDATSAANAIKSQADAAAKIVTNTAVGQSDAIVGAAQNDAKQIRNAAGLL